MSAELLNENTNPNFPLTKKDKPTVKQHPSIDTLPLDEQRILYRREQIIKALIEMRRKYGRIPRGECHAAAVELKVSLRMVHEYMKNYIAYAEVYPDEPTVNVLIPLPSGRPEGSGGILTDDHKAVIKYAILKRSRITIYSTGRVDEAPDYDFEVLDVYRFVKAICEDIGSYDTLRRYINRWRHEKAALCKIFIEGRDAFERDSTLKRRNDVTRPNQRWQCDVRYLPFYIVHEGQICPVALIIIYDDFSRYIVAWKLIPMVKQEKNGHLRRVHVTARNIGELMAFAMLSTGVRPEEFYTDNGPEFVGLEPFLPHIADDPPIRFVHSRPRKPWGRGKIENGLGQVTKLLRRIAAGYRPKKDRPSIDLARKTARLSLAELETEFEEHYKALLIYKPKTRPSRMALWTGAESHPVPSIRKLALLNIPSKRDSVVVNKSSINTLSDEWEPKFTSIKHIDVDIHKRWADAVERAEENVLWGIQLYGQWYAEVCLQGLWVILIPKRLSNENSIKVQQSAIADLTKEGRLYVEEGEKVINRLVGGLPGRKTSTGEYLSVEETEQAKLKHIEAEASKKKQKKAEMQPEQPLANSMKGEEEGWPVISGLEEAMQQLEERLRQQESALCRNS